MYLTGRRLDRALAGRELLAGQLRHPRYGHLDLAGRRVREVVSVGKHLLIRFDRGHSLHSHLRMDGAWHLYRPGGRWRGPGHQVRAVLSTSERMAVGFRLHDLVLLPTRDEHRLIGHLGPDLLGAEWGPQTATQATRRLAARADQELGLALLDQTVLAGVGNLYKAEVCFLLGVSPWAPVSRVDPARAVTLCRELLARNAERPEQSTTNELALGARNWVFERGGAPCRRCGDTVITARQGSGTGERVAYFCPSCQPGPRPDRRRS